MASFDYVYIENTSSTRELSFPVPGPRKRVVIPPGEKEIFPFDIAAGTFGHPALRNDPKKRHRTEQYAMLRLYFGFSVGFDVETDAELRGKTPDIGSWESKCPPFKVTTLQGDYIPMILDDPEGVQPIPEDNGIVSPDLARASGNTAVMERTLADMQRQIAELTAKLTEQAAPIIDDSALPPVPANEAPPKVDSPKSPASRIRNNG
jgi:hypothetical protein